MLVYVFFCIYDVAFYVYVVSKIVIVVMNRINNIIVNIIINNIIAIIVYIHFISEKN